MILVTGFPKKDVTVPNISKKAFEEIATIIERPLNHHCVNAYHAPLMGMIMGKSFHMIDLNYNDDLLHRITTYLKRLDRQTVLNIILNRFRRTNQ